jgi:hypothetical protein
LRCPELVFRYFPAAWQRDEGEHVLGELPFDFEPGACDFL